MVRSFSVTSASVVLTRQAGSNAKATKALLSRGVRPIELPLIEFKTRPEAGQLTTLLTQRRFDWVTLTSPQAAKVFLEAWREADSPVVQVA